MDKCNCKDKKKEQNFFNIQLKRLQCETLNELAKEVTA